MRITAIEPFVCDGGLREFGFLKVTTDEGIVGWAETYDWHTVRLARDRAPGHGPASSSARTRAASSCSTSGSGTAAGRASRSG